eukprot:5701332-Pleurochrysis_carterae.AAC.1
MGRREKRERGRMELIIWGRVRSIPRTHAQLTIYLRPVHAGAHHHVGVALAQPRQDVVLSGGRWHAGAGGGGGGGRLATNTVNGCHACQCDACHDRRSADLIFSRAVRTCMVLSAELHENVQNAGCRDQSRDSFLWPRCTCEGDAADRPDRLGMHACEARQCPGCCAVSACFYLRGSCPTVGACWTTYCCGPSPQPEYLQSYRQGRCLLWLQAWASGANAIHAKARHKHANPGSCVRRAPG